MIKIEAINLELERLHFTYRDILGYVESTEDHEDIYAEQLSAIEQDMAFLHRILASIDKEISNDGTNTMATLDSKTTESDS